MGELADDVADMLRDARRTSYHRGMTETHQDLVDRIERLEAHVAELEQWQEAQFTGAAAPLTNRRLPHNDGMSVVEFRTRLADAEQRAAAAWAAVTELVATGGRVVDMEKSYDDSITEVRIEGRAGIGRWQELLSLSSESGIQSMRFAVIVPSAPANPDLLERASVELAEAYQRAKAEEQRQAEEKAGPPATTASMDAIAKDFAERVVARIKAEAGAERKHPAFAANPSPPPADGGG